MVPTSGDLLDHMSEGRNQSYFGLKRQNEESSLGHMHGRVLMTEQVVQQRLDLEKYLSPLVRFVDGVLPEDKTPHRHRIRNNVKKGATDVMLNRLCTSDEVG